MHGRLLEVGVGVLGGGLVAVFVVLAVAMASGVGGLAEGRTGSDLGPAPRFSVPQFGGGSFDLDEHAGRPVFIYFWASWCVPCETEAPIIESLWPEYREPAGRSSASTSGIGRAMRSASSTGTA